MPKSVSDFTPPFSHHDARGALPLLPIRARRPLIRLIMGLPMLRSKRGQRVRDHGIHDEMQIRRYRPASAARPISLRRSCRQMPRSNRRSCQKIQDRTACRLQTVARIRWQWSRLVKNAGRYFNITNACRAIMSNASPTGDKCRGPANVVSSSYYVIEDIIMKVYD